MKQLRVIFALFAFSFMFAGPLVSVAAPTQVSAACDGRLLGIPPWYRGLTTGSGANCTIVGPEAGKIGVYVTKIALNIIEMGMVIVAYIALFFLLYGGFQFIVGGDNSSKIEKARHTILNAVIGLAIALGSVGILNLIFRIVQ